MSRTKYLKGPCAYCGGRVEFPAEAIGTTADCPHCGRPTELRLETVPDEPTIPRKGIIYAIIAGLILGLGFVGALAALKRAERMVAQKKERATPATSTNSTVAGAPIDPPLQAATQTGFQISAITLEKTQGSSLVYAVGQVRNLTTKQRFGVKVELDLLDSAGAKVGSAKDYQPVLEPNGQWQFRALVTDSKAASAKLAAIKEAQ
jgi:hypothetical protein